MKELLIYLLKTGLCLSLFWAVYELFLKRETFFGFIRGYLLTGLFISALLPFFHYSYDVILPVQSQPVEIVSDGIPVTMDTELPSPAKSITLWDALGIVYLSGVILFVLIHFRRFRKLFQWVRQGNYSRGKGYILVEDVAIKHSFSIMKYIFMPSEGLQQREKEIILDHEKHHIRQRHWIDLLFCELFVILQWFNPIVRRYISCIKNNHEYLADRGVLQNGTSEVSYKELLISQTLQHSLYFNNSFTSSFNYSPLKRLFMMSKKKSSAWKKVSVLILAPLFGIWVWATATPQYVTSLVEDHIELTDSLPVLSFITYASAGDTVITSAVYDKIEFKAAAKSVVSMGESFKLTYEVDGEGKDFNIPEITDFKMVKEPVVSMIVNHEETEEGKIIRTLKTIYTYVLSPTKEGEFKMPLATIVVDNVKYTSSRVTVKVVPPGQASIEKKQVSMFEEIIGDMTMRAEKIEKNVAPVILQLF